MFSIIIYEFATEELAKIIPPFNEVTLLLMKLELITYRVTKLFKFMRAKPSVKPIKSVTVRFMKIKTLVVLKVMDEPNLVISLFS